MITADDHIAARTDNGRGTERQKIKNVKSVENSVNHIVRIKPRRNHLITTPRTVHATRRPVQHLTDIHSQDSCKPIAEIVMTVLTGS